MEQAGTTEEMSLAVAVDRTGRVEMELGIEEEEEEEVLLTGMAQRKKEEAGSRM